MSIVSRRFRQLVSSRLIWDHFLARDFPRAHWARLCSGHGNDDGDAGAGERDDGDAANTSSRALYRRVHKFESHLHAQADGLAVPASGSLVEGNVLTMIPFRYGISRMAADPRCVFNSVFVLARVLYPGKVVVPRILRIPGSPEAGTLWGGSRLPHEAGLDPSVLAADPPVDFGVCRGFPRRFTGDGPPPPHGPCRGRAIVTPATPSAQLPGALLAQVSRDGTVTVFSLPVGRRAEPVIAYRGDLGRRDRRGGGAPVGAARDAAVQIAISCGLFWPGGAACGSTTGGGGSVESEQPPRNPLAIVAVAWRSGSLEIAALAFDPEDASARVVSVREDRLPRSFAAVLQATSVFGSSSCLTPRQVSAVHVVVATPAMDWHGWSVTADDGGESGVVIGDRRELTAPGTAGPTTSMISLFDPRAQVSARDGKGVEPERIDAFAPGIVVVAGDRSGHVRVAPASQWTGQVAPAASLSTRLDVTTIAAGGGRGTWCVAAGRSGGIVAIDSTGAAARGMFPSDITVEGVAMGIDAIVVASRGQVRAWSTGKKG